MSSATQNEDARRRLDSITDVQETGSTELAAPVVLVDADGKVSGAGAFVKAPELEDLASEILAELRMINVHLGHISGLGED